MKNKPPITKVATTDISEMLSPAPGRRTPMRGFDDEFVDIADYIIRITDRIWHERKIELCLKYYAEDSVIHTLTGDIVGAATVEANTHATLAAFPDRTLDGDNVIWSGDEDEGFYSSHLITSRMTNLGPSEFGPATGKRARIRTIADCVCKENKIVEEWLVRDNASLLMQLGLDPTEVARSQAENDAAAGRSLIETLSRWRDKTLSGASKTEAEENPQRPEADAASFASFVLDELWNRKNLDALPDLFDFRVGAHLTANRDLYGTVEYKEYLKGVFAALPDLIATVDHVAVIPYLGDAKDIAVRWSMAGTHTGGDLFGAASGAPVYILGASHWRVMNGRIREEWTVFDELALLRQIETHRLQQ
ncbi:MAG: ester cyclase [Pseudomonadota bacterium]